MVLTKFSNNWFLPETNTRHICDEKYRKSLENKNASKEINLFQNHADFTTYKCKNSKVQDPRVKKCWKICILKS